MVRTIKDINNPVICRLSGTKPLDIHKTDFLRLARFIALNISNPNAGIQLFAGKGRAADVQFEFLGQTLSRRRNQISEEIGADHQDKTRHKKHPAESPWPDARNSKNRELAR